MPSRPDRAGTTDEIPHSPARHREILDARLADYEADPEAGRPWEQVEADLRERLSLRR